jgi:hypothetical protein
VRLVPRVVDSCDHLLDAVLLLGELPDDDVVLVVARDGDDDVGRSGDAGALEDEELRAVAVDRAVLELLLQPLEAGAVLLDERDLVVEREERAGDADPDLAPADDDDEHQTRSPPSADSLRASMAVPVGETTSKPRPE